VWDRIYPGKGQCSLRKSVSPPQRLANNFAPTLEIQPTQIQRGSGSGSGSGFVFDLDLRRPVKPRRPNFDVELQGKPAGRRFSRTGPGMALCGGPATQCRSSGMPSPGEGPSGGARAFCLLLGFSKVRRCKSATLSGRYRDNGYVRIPPVGPDLSGKRSTLTP